MSYDAVTIVALKVLIDLMAVIRFASFNYKKVLRPAWTDERGVPRPGNLAAATLPINPMSLTKWA